MNPKLARLLTRLYPRCWRNRYGAEFEALLESSDGNLRTSINVARSAVCERIRPTQALTMDETSHSAQLQANCIRAPWAMFSIAPLFLLAGAYVVACLILWSGWSVFLPGTDTPFGGNRLYGFANLYFQFGKFCYFSAPVFVGWAIELIALRQRSKAVWPAIGLVLTAWLGGTAQIEASRTAVRGGLGHIRMNFAIWPSVHNMRDGLLHALIIFSLMALPYLFWRLQKARSLSS